MKKEATHVRISCLMLLALCLWLLPATVGAAPGDKKVNVDFKSVPVKTVLDAIQKQAGLNFVYSSQLAATWPKVSITAKQEPAVQVIERLTGLINCSYKINGDVVSISQQQKSGRERTVKGYVRDADGEPLVGVPVSIGDGNVLAVTDVNGSYNVTIPVEQTVLKYSYVGMETAYVTIPRGNKEATRDIVLKSDNHLEDVIVTGYQEISKPKMTGAVTTVSMETLSDRYTENIMDNLEGRVAGLSTYNGKMIIRGTSSLYAETSPLLVVDGIPVEGKIEDLNPYDIASVNVLKDAAAAAIYGARASNGIIVVTTKNANKRGKIDIDFSTNLTIYEKRNMDYHDNFYMNPEEQVNMESTYWDYYYFHNGGEIADPLGSTATDIAGGRRDISPIQYLYYQNALGKLSDTDLQSKLNILKKNNYAQDFADAVYKQQILQQYNLSLRSRTDNTRNNLILNFKKDNEGIINALNNNFQISYKGSYDLTKWLTATVNINGVFQKIRHIGTAGPYTNPWACPAYENFWNSDGTPAYHYYSMSGNAYLSLGDDYDQMGTTPLEEYYNNVEVTRRQNIRYHGNLLFKIIDGLTAEAQFVYENERSTADWIANQQSYVARIIRNAYATKNADGSMSRLTPEKGGLLRSSNVYGRYWTARGQINYNKTIGKHDIVALAGLEFRETKSNGTRALLLGYDDQLQVSSSQTIDFGQLSNIQRSATFLSGMYPAKDLVYNIYFRDSMGLIPENHHKYASGYMNATYTYDERYNVFWSFRKDYADVYGLNAKFRGKPLWSVGAGWLLYNEPFVKKLHWVNFLKLRVSYGVTGNIYQGATSYMTATSGSLNQYYNRPTGKIESPANPNLKWEQSRTTNVGFDFVLFKDRLRGAVDYYKKVGKDIFSYMTLDPTTGFTTMFVNMASMRNNGVEVQLTYDWLKNSSRDLFGWTTNFTFSHNTNKVTNVENPSTSASGLISNPYKTDYPVSAIWSYRFAGISGEEGMQGKPMWYIENNETSTTPESHQIEILEFSGQTEPKMMIGLDNGFRWKGFSLNLLMVYYGGHKMRALEEYENQSAPYSAVASYFLHAWTEENPTNSPGIGQYGSNTITGTPAYSNNNVRDAAFLKIRNIVFGYDFNPQLLRKLGINRLSLNFQINNPKYLWVKNDVGVDPETLGIRNPSSFVFGLNINL